VNATTLVLGLLVLILAVGFSRLVQELRRRRHDAAVLQILGTLAPAIAEARADPRRILTWHPIAAGLRREFPEAFGALDRAVGGTFPFGRDQIQAAHGRCTADWLAWERAHDFEYKLKASAAEEELERRGEARSAVGRKRLEQIEREQLERYQERYEEYVRTAKALQALIDGG
jgi:hypothetical protein